MKVKGFKRRPGQADRRAATRAVAIRLFASLCAVGLVVAFAIAATLPVDMDLGAMLLAMDPSTVASLHQFTERVSGDVIWHRVVLPFLLRPDWLLPLMAGVVAGGVAISLSQIGAGHHSTRRSG